METKNNLNFFAKIIVEKITSNDRISIFFHDSPDFDTLGAAFALRRYIRDKFSNKKVEIIGLDTVEEAYSSGLFEFERRHIPSSFIKGSLGIVVDVGDKKRIYSKRHTECKELVVIDHHPKTSTTGKYLWVDQTYPATCQMVAELMIGWDPRFLLQQTAMYLYAGILTDTNRFLYNSTLASTYQVVSTLISTGFDRDKVHNAIYLRNYTELKFSSYVVGRIKLNKEYGIAYAKIGKNAFDKYGVDLRYSMVNLLSNIIGVDIWVTYYYDKLNKRWRGSIRSNGIQINQVAAKHGGGGHKNAAAFTLKKPSDFAFVLNDLKKTVKQNKVK